MELTGQQRKQLLGALTSAFPTYSSLEQLLDFELDKRLNQITPDSNFQNVVYEVIKTAISQGWLEDLVFAAHDSNPGNQLLLSFLMQHYLKSDRNVDYTKLRDLLKAGQWFEADKETDAVMLKASGMEKERRLKIKYIKSIENFPCADLLIIDQLWVRYSNGLFGFSVQKQIYHEVGGLLDNNLSLYKEAFDKFGDRVGWNVKNISITKKNVTFNTTIPRGYLPMFKWGWWGGYSGVSLYMFVLFSRVETCKL